jgi:hypothetical protein
VPPVPHPCRPSTRFNLCLFQFILLNYCNNKIQHFMCLKRSDGVY